MDAALRAIAEPHRREILRLVGDDELAAGVGLERFAGMEQDDSGVWTAPGGAQVAWFTDPDGNVLSVTQSPIG